jgi:AGCS family alanine or glycine:cation symporter
LFGGLKRISKVCESIIPLFAVIYITCCLLIIILNITKIPNAFVEIIQMAFTSKSAAGGIVGYTVLKAITNGAQKGIFANEAGLGSTPIALATAKTKSATDQGLMSMAAMAVTMIICLLTGLAVVVTGVWSQGFEGVYITDEAFKAGLPFNEKFTSIVLMVCICVFAFTSMIGWCVYGQKSMNYLTNNNKVFEKIYLIIYVISIFFGAILKVDLIWNMADIFNGLMAIPNLIALICLSKVVSKETIEELKI